ncbi:MAG: S-adenosylmethionine:tRNA ribosyltransferase-isomerase, partial [Candidatus Latescibacteria bacterium]|nr:S-adenosylmethionine:tRNA ribosyltransferase-isomerase [Candidatus Latescibacterota bacterium]
MKLTDYNFDLPEELIAQQPNKKRISSKLLHVKGHVVKDRVFSELPELLKKNDLLIVNDTKVMSSRLFGKKITGGKVE